MVVNYFDGITIECALPINRQKTLPQIVSLVAGTLVV